jgi:hypothetical protein
MPTEWHKEARKVVRIDNSPKMRYTVSSHIGFGRFPKTPRETCSREVFFVIAANGPLHRLPIGSARREDAQTPSLVP